MARSFNFGSHIRLQEGYIYHIDDIYSLHTPHSFQLYYNYSVTTRRIDVLASDQTLNRLKREYPRSLLSSRLLLNTLNNEIWYHTSASLIDIVEITACKEVSHEGFEVVGALFSYADGHKESIGQYRLDYDLESHIVVPVTHLHVGTKRNRLGLSYVAFLRVTQLPNEQLVDWLDIPLSGRLEWWYSLRQSRIDHIF